MSYSVGSLFDGSGGFPLAGTLCGMEPRWASEVEPYPIAVTRSRFPDMKHLGDISKINGAEIEPVDVITFGSPCQDLSVAGRQAGLKHESNGDSETTRSGLFMEAVRIIKEMRRATDGEYPKFAIWENVPGAFSSNKGEDFRTVLEEIIKISEPEAPAVPATEKSGWPYADCVVGDGWSIAYRTFDAQHWGVPQRRRRVYLVADFTGGCAEKVLFEREGLRGYFAESGTPRESTAADITESAGEADREGQGITFEPGILRREGGHFYEGISGTLRANAGDNRLAVAYSIENHPADSRVNIDDGGKVQTLTSRMGTGGGNVPMVMEPFCKSARGRFKGDAETWKPAEVSNTLNTFDQGEARANELVVEALAVYCLQGNGIDRADTAGCNGKGWRENASYTLNTIDRPAVAYKDGTYTASKASFFTRGSYERADCLVATDYKDPPIINGDAEGGYIVRRLTPTECARLQGFPDWWGYIEPKDDLAAEEYGFWLEVRNTHAAVNGKTVKDYTEAQMLAWYNKLHSDSAEYKMWGNGVALFPTLYVMQGIAEALNDRAA